MKPPYAAPLSHYYGNIVRKLFLAGAAIMLLTLPFSLDRIPIPVFPAVIIILLLGLFAGLTNPIKSWPVMIDTLIALVGVASFEFYAVAAYQNTGPDFYFWITQGLAVIFLFALYYSTKTFRAMMLESK